MQSVGSKRKPVKSSLKIGRNHYERCRVLGVFRSFARLQAKNIPIITDRESWLIACRLGPSVCLQGFYPRPVLISAWWAVCGTAQADKLGSLQGNGVSVAEGSAPMSATAWIGSRPPLSKNHHDEQASAPSRPELRRKPTTSTKRGEASPGTGVKLRTYILRL